MKTRTTTAVLLALLLVVTLAGFSFGQERLTANRAFLLDFGIYEGRVAENVVWLRAEWEKERTNEVPRGLPTENTNYQMDAKDWKLDQWEIELNDSASSVINNVLSYVTNVVSTEWTTKHEIYKDQKVIGYTNTTTGSVLGARIHFPVHRQNCWAIIKPPFEIAAYIHSSATTPTFFMNANNGVVYNVGQIRNLSTWVKGRNYKNSLAVRLKDSEGLTREYFFGDLHFDNWRLLTWNNPNYIEEPKDRILVRLPLYPRSMPFVKFTGFVVYRQMDDLGGDFILYIRDLKIEYDKAIDDDDIKDINDELVWGILRNEQRIERQRQMLRLAEKKALLERERRKLENTRLRMP
jgi:hypothetical protein